LRTVYLLGNTVTFVNKQNLPVGRPIIFLANHQGLLDIPPLIWYLRKYHAKFISKIELTKNIPSISYNLSMAAAPISIVKIRASPSEIVKLAVRMKENNWSAVIFPEGTRSKMAYHKTVSASGHSNHT
jgi:1-acyl-sn-glycerol-3-phosphate acyltransferase